MRLSGAITFTCTIADFGMVGLPYCFAHINPCVSLLVKEDNVYASYNYVEGKLWMLGLLLMAKI